MIIEITKSERGNLQRFPLFIVQRMEEKHAKRTNNATGDCGST